MAYAAAATTSVDPRSLGIINGGAYLVTGSSRRYFPVVTQWALQLPLPLLRHKRKDESGSVILLRGLVRVFRLSLTYNTDEAQFV